MNHTDPVAALCASHGETNPEQLILRLCQELIAHCAPRASAIPLPVLASWQGVREIHSRPINPAAGCSGLLVPSDGGYEITVNSGEPRERQNFSIAHEIVHTFFREACPCSRPSSREEQLCNLGAAELTMPAERFARHLARAGLSLAGIDSCAKNFDVSFEAAARRAMNCTSQPACLFVAALSRTKQQEQLDSGQPILRIVKWRPSQSWPYPSCYKNRPVDPNSLIGQSFAHQDERHGYVRLGLPFDSSVYELEARGYSYPREGNQNYRQAVSLARVRPGAITV